MNTKNQLSVDERNLFALVYQAGTVSPFSEQRVALENQIARMGPASASSNRFARALDVVQSRIAAMQKEGNYHLSHFDGKDRQLLKGVYLFDFFHRYRKQFDELIQAQINQGNVSVKVSFATEALEYLRQKGFELDDSCRYFALSYQLRRAYFFICRSLIGRSAAMQRLRLQLWSNVFTSNIELYDRYLWNRLEDFSTLLLGETGTGKGTAAMAIGRSGFIPFNEKKRVFVESFTRSFMSINLSQFTDTLIESELFGHKKGAFTGAVKDHKGVFARCSPYGAILLDEIGDLSVTLQIKLLQILQERMFSPVGSHINSRFQGRVIAATNRSIEEIRKKKLFRDDFYYRLCSDVITVPPLRDRIREHPGELDELLAFTVERMVGKPSPELVRMTRQVIDDRLGKNYPWPGNVRELEQCVRRVILKGSYERNDLAVVGDDSLQGHLADGMASGDLDAQQLITGYCFLLYQRHGTFEEVARRTRLDRRTAKKYINEWEAARDKKQPF